MKRRLLVALTGIGLLVGVSAAPALAAGGAPARYQVGTTTYTVAVLDTYMHTFVVTANPCDGSIAITGSTPADSGYFTTETVTGTLANGIISFNSTYVGPYNPGYTWSGSFPVAGGALGGEFTGTVTAAPTTFTTFATHGDYVSSSGGGADAAHSCIGMPVVSNSGAGLAALTARFAAIEGRLVANLEAVVTRLEAKAPATAHAVAAIQKHVDAIKAGTAGPGHASAAASGTVAHGKATTPPANAQGHPTRGSHPGKP